VGASYLVGARIVHSPALRRFPCGDGPYRLTRAAHQSSRTSRLSELFSYAQEAEDSVRTASTIWSLLLIANLDADVKIPHGAFPGHLSRRIPARTIGEQIVCPGRTATIEPAAAGQCAPPGALACSQRQHH